MPPAELDYVCVWPSFKHRSCQAGYTLGGCGLRAVEKLDVALSGLILRVTEQALEYRGRDIHVGCERSVGAAEVM